MNSKEIADQIQILLDTYRNMQARSQYTDLSDLPDRRTFDVQLRAAIERLTPLASPYRQEAIRQESLPTHKRIPVYVGILQALSSDIENGWYESITELIHSDTLVDVVEQAEELLAKSYKDAAAVVLGVALETHLRLLAEKSQIPTVQQKGGHVKADFLNAELTKAGVYNSIQQKSVTAWLGIRNAAAHGQTGEYSDAEVRLLMAAVPEFIARYPA